LVSTLELKQNIVAAFRIFNDNTTWQFQRFILGSKKRIVEYDQFCMETKSYPIEDGDL
jgi:hypothetical protein